MRFFSLHLEGKKIAYLPGYEYQTAKEQQKPLKTLKTFCTDCDILIHDAFHLENKDYMEGWARCTFQQAYEFAREVNPKTLIFFGYHPESTDEKLDRKFAEMEKQAASDDVSFELIAAKEGLNLEL
jgi:ribonuclease BN (tRNA processing enzyme)